MACTCLFPVPQARAQEFLDRLDEALTLKSADGSFRAELSVLLDLEGYLADDPPFGLLFTSDGLVTPRASFFVDLRMGEHFYGMVQVRVDEGFDPKSKNSDARFDEYFLRFIPFQDGRLNLQVGKFATFVGNWVPRHESWKNPFITAPLPYENVLVISDRSVAKTPSAFLARRDQADKKDGWVPVLWGPSYTTGAAVLGRHGPLDYAVEVKNASLSSRPSVWGPEELTWHNPTVSGRVGYLPNAAWTLGASFSHGAYLLPEANAGLPAGRDIGDFNQSTLGADLSYSWLRWQFWGEVFVSRFEVPYVGNTDTLAYYLEAKYKLTPELFAALRWNQQIFGHVDDGTGREERWDNDVYRIDASLGYQLTRHVQAKVQYSFSHQDASWQQGEHLLAGQVTVRF